jgi:hypothetical protein
MNHSDKLIAIKIFHTLIWIFFAGLIFYILYAGISNQINTYTWIAIGLVIGEGIVLILFNMFCPLTILKDNFDIFLPNWLARNNKIIFTAIFLTGLIIVLVREFIYTN